MELLKSKEVSVKLKVCYDTFRKVIKHQPDFPEPVLLHPKAKPKWRDCDIENYLKSKAA